MTNRSICPGLLVLVLLAVLPACARSSFGAQPLPEGARVERNVAYGADPEQRMDIYIPAHAKNAPVVLMVHGGAWLRGDKAMARMYGNKVAHWLPRGVIFISINYRLAPKADPLTQADDVAKALAVAQEKAASWGGGSERFVLMGHSAGAHLVALLVADPSIATRQGAKPWLGAVVLDSGALDLVEIMEGSHFRFYDRVFKDDPAYWQKASPLHRFVGTPQPMLIVCSTKRDDSCPPSQDFAAKATSLGGRASVLPIAMTHREINEDLGLAGAYTDAVDSFLRSLGLP